MSLRAATQGSAYLLTHRSWTRRIGTGLRKCNFSRPRRRVTTRPASSSCFRCFITPNRVIAKRCSRAFSVWPSSRKSSSSSARRVGSASALKTSSTWSTIGDHLVTCQRPDAAAIRRWSAAAFRSARSVWATGTWSTSEGRVSAQTCRGSGSLRIGPDHDALMDGAQRQGRDESDADTRGDVRLGRRELDGLRREARREASPAADGDRLVAPEPVDPDRGDPLVGRKVLEVDHPRAGEPVADRKHDAIGVVEQVDPDQSVRGLVPLRVRLQDESDVDASRA